MVKKKQIVFLASFLVAMGFMSWRVWLLYSQNQAFFFSMVALEFIVLISVLFIFLWICFRWPDESLWTLMVLAVVVFGWRYWVLYQQTTISYLQVSLHSTVESTAQLFYDAGRGFNEADSTSIIIRAGERNHDYLFRLPKATLFALRFDPFTTGGTMRIENMKMVDGLGHRLHAVDLRQWHPTNQILELSYSQDSLNIITEKGAFDPQMVIAFSFPLKLNRDRFFITTSLVGRALLELTVIGIVVSLIFLAIKKRQSVQSEQIRIKLWFFSIFYLLICLMLFYIYAEGAWWHTIKFIKNLFAIRTYNFS